MVRSYVRSEPGRAPIWIPACSSSHHEAVHFVNVCQDLFPDNEQTPRRPLTVFQMLSNTNCYENRSLALQRLFAEPVRNERAVLVSRAPNTAAKCGAAVVMDFLMEIDD